MSKCVAVLNTDNGAGHPKGWKVESRKDVKDAMQPISDALLKDISGGALSLETTYDTDHGPFMLQGVPALDLWVVSSDSAPPLMSFSRASLMGCIASFTSLRLSTFQPFGWPAPLSVFSTATALRHLVQVGLRVGIRTHNPCSSRPKARTGY